VAEYLECPHCGGMMRPNVVWFGENLPEDVWMKAEQATLHCDVFLSIGTSSEVYPAAGLPLLAKRQGAFVAEINPGRTGLTPEAHAYLCGTSGTILPRILQAVQS
jgi:NAD-dependent deacetylase